jgi:peroxiredoxin-like protein
VVTLLTCVIIIIDFHIYNKNVINRGEHIIYVSFLSVKCHQKYIQEMISMKDLPHIYTVKSLATATGNLTTRADKVPDISVAPPAEFGGPGDVWSPEGLLMAALANCFVLSFRAIARASKLTWLDIECESDGELDKVERKVKFTKVLTKVKLTIPSSEDKEKAEKLLSKAEETCFVSNSMTCETHLECEIVFSD